ncbi:unnamed protein product [Closterium sp. NIES-64]|nr:unnamed protein product [Closterium sp. NIES-64]
MHHNYAVEKWLIELYTSHAAAIYGWKVVFRGDSEEAGGVRGDASEIPASAAAAGAGASAAAGDSAGGADGGGGGGAAAAGDSAGGGASAAGAGAAAAAAAAAAGGAAGDNSEWGESVFCLVPPSRAQWTVQLAKAILSGCIPVTFLRANDNPWAASLHHQKAAPSSATATAPASAAPTAPSSLNYLLFSLNVDPADLHSLPRRLQDAFDQPGLVERLQHNLGLVQVGTGVGGSAGGHWGGWECSAGGHWGGWECRWALGWVGVQVGTGVGGSAGEARAGGHWGWVGVQVRLVQVGTGVGGTGKVNSPPAAASPPAALNYPVFLLNVDPADLHSLPHRLQVGIVAGGTGAGETGAGETGAGGTGAGVTGAGGTGAGGTSAGGTGAGGTSAGGTGAGGTGAAMPIPQDMLKRHESLDQGAGADMFKWHGSLDQGAGAVLIPLSVFPMSRGGAHEQAEEDWSSGAIAAHHSSLLISLLCTFLPQDMFKWHDSLDQGAGAVLMSRLRRIGAAAAAQITAA